MQTYSDIQKEQINKFYALLGLRWNDENNKLLTPGFAQPAPGLTTSARETCKHVEAVFENDKLLRITYGTLLNHVLPIEYEILDLERRLIKPCGMEVPVAKK